MSHHVVTAAANPCSGDGGAKDIIDLTGDSPNEKKRKRSAEKKRKRNAEKKRERKAKKKRKRKAKKKRERKAKKKRKRNAEKKREREAEEKRQIEARPAEPDPYSWACSGDHPAFSLDKSWIERATRGGPNCVSREDNVVFHALKVKRLRAGDLTEVQMYRVCKSCLAVNSRKVHYELPDGKLAHKHRCGTCTRLYDALQAGSNELFANWQKEQERKKRTAKKHVYAIRRVGTNIVKIGCTCHPVSARFSGLQTNTPHKLEIVACIAFDGNKKDMEWAEKILRSKFKSIMREWCRVDNETLLAEMRELQSSMGKSVLLTEFKKGIMPKGCVAGYNGKMSTTNLYVVRLKGTNFVKIGLSDNVVVRVYAFKSSNIEEVEILYTCTIHEANYNALKTERKFHAKAAEISTAPKPPGGSEWFQLAEVELETLFSNMPDNEFPPKF